MVLKRPARFAELVRGLRAADPLVRMRNGGCSRESLRARPGVASFCNNSQLAGSRLQAHDFRGEIEIVLTQTRAK